MASEVQFINCQELHNPFFTPRIVSAQEDISPDGKSQKSRAAEVPSTAPVSSSVITSPLGEASPGSGSDPKIAQEDQSSTFPDLQNLRLEVSNSHQFEPGVPLVTLATPTEAYPSQSLKRNDLSESCITAISPGSPSILVSPKKVLPVCNSSPQIAPVKQSLISQNCGQVGDANLIVAEHEDAAREPADPTPAPKYHELLSSDLNDDVQFILAVTRKRRKKRPRQNLLPGHQGKNLSDDAGKNTPKNISNDAGGGASLQSHNAGLKSAVVQSLPCHHQGLQNSQDESSFPSLSLSFLPATSPVSAAPIPETQKQRTKKRKRNQENGLTSAPQTLGSTTENNELISVQTPISEQRLLLQQRVRPSGPIPNVHHTPVAQLANNIQLGSIVGTHCQPHGPGHQYQHITGSFIQPHVPPLAGSVTSPVQASLLSNSISESLRRRPSLYSVPQWQAPPLGPGMAILAEPAKESRRISQGPYVSRDALLSSAAPLVPRMAKDANLFPGGIGLCGHFSPSADLGACSVQQPAAPPKESSTSQPGLLKKSYPPNMLVDIAQTCQDNFPFAQIAKRHNQPIQKVFDIFSAVIQLPLLRSAVDARRPGKLGSLRMKEFRALKKGAKAVPNEELGRKRGGKKAEKRD